MDAPEGIESLAELFAATKPTTPAIRIFPQADTLGTVIAAVELYANDVANTEEVSASLGFDPRQGHYYTTAAEWLGLVERNGAQRQLNARGKNFVAATRTQRFKMLFQAIAATPVFCEFIRRKLGGKIFSLEEIAEEISAQGFADGSTPRRRARTVTKWLDWLWHEHVNLAQETR